MSSKIDQIIEEFALEASKIYDNRTAGTYTWNGFLFLFLMEILNSGEVVRAAVEPDD